jgi:hypothetical protein
MKIGDLKPGEFAITKNEDMLIMGVSPLSFVVSDEMYAHTVHVANGVGNFFKNSECTKIMRSSPIFAIQNKWL